MNFCPTCSGPTHILYYGFLHLIYVFRGEISLFYGFHDMFTLPVRVPACNICSHRDDFCSRGSTQLHICFTRSNTAGQKEHSLSCSQRVPPGNFLLHGFGTRAKIQAAFSHSNLLLRNRDATVGSAFFLRHDSRSRHGKTAGSSCSWPWALRGDWTKPPPAPWAAEMGRPQWVDDASKKVTARPLNLLNASPTSPPA